MDGHDERLVGSMRVEKGREQWCTVTVGGGRSRSFSRRRSNGQDVDGNKRKRGRGNVKQKVYRWSHQEKFVFGVVKYREDRESLRLLEGYRRTQDLLRGVISDRVEKRSRHCERRTSETKSIVPDDIQDLLSFDKDGSRKHNDKKD